MERVFTEIGVLFSNFKSFRKWSGHFFDFWPIFRDMAVLKKLRFKVQISENGQVGSKTYFLVKSILDNLILTSVSKQKYSYNF